MHTIYVSNSVDHKGDFRVGDLFRINQETGEVTFTNAEFLFNNNQGITFTDVGYITSKQKLKAEILELAEILLVVRAATLILIVQQIKLIYKTMLTLQVT